MLFNHTAAQWLCWCFRAGADQQHHVLTNECWCGLQACPELKEKVFDSLRHSVPYGESLT